MSEKFTGEVKFQLDPDNLPTISQEQMARLQCMSDEDIDYTDIPPQGDKPGRRVQGPRFGAPPQALVLEPDVLRFFHESGDVSPRRINAILREYAESHRKSA